MKKAELAALEKLFVYEINQAFAKGVARYLPMQSRAKVYAELEADGLVRRVERRIGSDRLGCTVRGWELTHAGRLGYCMTCSDELEVA